MLSICTWESSGGVHIWYIICPARESVSPAKGISDIRRQVGKAFVRSMGASGVLEEEPLLPLQLGLVSTPVIFSVP